MALEKELTENAQEIFEWIKQAKDFAVEQSPLVVQELIHYRTVVCGITMCAFVFMFLLILIGSITWYYYCLKSTDPDTFLIAFCFTIIPLLILGGYSISWINNFLLIYLAPRVYVLEYFKDLIN